VIQRWHPLYELESVVIVVGENFVTANDMVIETVLGSCIAVCLRDPLMKIAGMNHFLLPGDPSTSGTSGRYGVNAMEQLLNAMMALGANRFRIEAKVFGGGNIDVAASSKLRIGDMNTEFVMNFLQVEGIPVISCDVGGNAGRRIVFFAHKGNVKLRRLGRSESISAESQDRASSEVITLRKPDLTLF
jgi:chemotaxis protein CheD